MEQMNEQVVTQMPRIGDQAPDFSAVTTLGNMKFSDYNKDHWVVLFSHPADFTPVCTTEMSAIMGKSNNTPVFFLTLLTHAT